MPRFIDLTGKSFGRLKVIRRTNKPHPRSKYWECACECGATCIAEGSHLRLGRTASCGCLRRESLSKIARRNATHGMKSTRTYRCWASMKSRCSNSRDPSFKGYGARGISVCERWLKFENFYDDMGEMPIGLSIERIDVNGNYEPRNCKWATQKEQNCNKTNTVFLTHNGETKTLTQWAGEMGVPASTMRSRVWQGWSDEETLTKPYVGRKRSKKCAN